MKNKKIVISSIIIILIVGIFFSANILEKNIKMQQSENDKIQISESDANKALNENKSSEQSVYLEIIDAVNDSSLFVGNVNIKDNKSLNEVMNEFLVKQGIKSVNQNGYIKMMYGLEEGKEGKSSGWIYYINGQKPSIGLKDCTLKSGDRITWKYIEDVSNE